MLKIITGALAVLGTALALPLAAQPLKVEARLDRSVLWSQGDRDIALQLNIEGLRRDAARRPALNLALVIDRSGSMSGDKIDKAREAARQLVERLRPDDVFSLVTFDDRVDVPVPAARLRRSSAALEAISALYPGGSTALYAGVSAGIAQAEKHAGRGRVSRVILLSDGLANVGPSSAEEVARLGRSAARDGIAVTTLGLGMGYDEDLLTRLAQSSDGNHAFIAEARDLPGILDRELGDALAVAARDIVIEIKLADGVRFKRCLGRDLEQDGQTLRLRLNQVAQGQAKDFIVELQAPAGRVGRSQDLARVELKAKDEKGDWAQDYRQGLRVDYSAEEGRAEASRDKDVSLARVKASANEAREEAVRLRDAGQASQASQLLKAEASKVQNFSVGASAPAAVAAQEFASSLEKEADAVGDEKKDWNVGRKAMKQKAYSTRNSQTY